MIDVRIIVTATTTTTTTRMRRIPRQWLYGTIFLFVIVDIDDEIP